MNRRRQVDENCSIGTVGIRKRNSGDPIGAAACRSAIVYRRYAARRRVGRHFRWKKSRGVMERGELVPDELVVEVVAQRILQPDAENGVR